MLRGKISNEISNIIAIDWRILVNKVDNELQIKSGAKEWIEKNIDRTFCVVVVGDFTTGNEISCLLEDFVREVKHFYNRYDMFRFMDTNPLIKIFYTNDTSFHRNKNSCNGYEVLSHIGWHQTLN